MLAVWRNGRVSPNLALSEGSRGGSAASSRLQSVLVAGQLALALTVLTGTGLLTSHAQALTRASLGVDGQHVLTAQVHLPPGTLALPEARRQFARALTNRLRMLPGVRQAGITTVNPLAGGSWEAAVEGEGRPQNSGTAPVLVNHRLVTPGLLDALGTPARARAIVHGRRRCVGSTGRDCEPASRRSTLARRRPRWAAGSATRATERTLADRRGYRGGREGCGNLDIHLVLSVRPARRDAARLLPRDDGAGVRTIRPVSDEASESAIRRIRSDAAVTDLAPLERMSQRDTGAGSRQCCHRPPLRRTGSRAGRPRRVRHAPAIFVASHGREFGIRIALGGQRGDVARVIVRRLGRLMLAGLAIGAFGSWGVTRALSAVVTGSAANPCQAFAAVCAADAHVADSLWRMFPCAVRPAQMCRTGTAGRAAAAESARRCSGSFEAPAPSVPRIPPLTVCGSGSSRQSIANLQRPNWKCSSESRVRNRSSIHRVRPCSPRRRPYGRASRHARVLE